MIFTYRYYLPMQFFFGLDGIEDRSFETDREHYETLLRSFSEDVLVRQLSW